MRSTAAAIKLRRFDLNTFLTTIGDGRNLVVCHEKTIVFGQGDACDAVFYIQKGNIITRVASKQGKEASINLLSAGGFFGEACLTGQPLRLASAIALTDCWLLRIEKDAMKLALHRERALSNLFVTYLLTRNVRYQEDLVDQLFHASEKRLARLLLVLAHVGEDGVRQTEIPKISQEILAEMVGTTRPRICSFMNRFRKLGLIRYSSGLEGKLRIHTSLVDMVLKD